MLSLELIRIDGDTQARVQLDQATVDEYADAYLSGAEFPPVTVFFDGVERWLADGFHRYFAAKKAGKKKILEHVIPGTKRDAILYSLKANATHGLKRTNADKRKAVETLLRDPEWVQWSDNKIAQTCGVGNQLVGDVRRSIFVNHKDAEAEHLGNSQDAPVVRKVERAGKTYEQDTSNIGKAKAEPASAPAAKQAPKLAPEEAQYFGPSDEEIQEAQAQAEQDMALLHKLIDTDDKLAAALEENKQQRAEIAVLKLQRDGYMNRSNELISRITSLKKKLAKAEAANA